jgi:hypothetical protein
MPKVRDILIHVHVDTALRRRICKRSGHAIAKGQHCLVVKTGPMRSPYPYDAESAQQILNAAWKKLLTLYTQLSLPPPS